MTDMDRVIRESRSCDTLTALEWCVQQRATVFFLDAGVVKVVVGGRWTGVERSLTAAVLAHVLAVEVDDRPLAAGVEVPVGPRG